MCNANFTYAYQLEPEEQSPRKSLTFQTLPRSGVSPLVWLVAIVFFILLTICSGVFVYLWWRVRPEKGDSQMQPALPPPAEYSLEKLKLSEIIGKF